MAAAAWTKTAEDITGQRERWDDYLTVEQLADRIGLGVGTILDTLTRNPREEDPRSIIACPAVRLGQSALNATPMWSEQQASEYLRRKGRSAGRTRPAKLPTCTLADAAERGLASVNELATVLGIAENSIRRWAREEPGFPVPVAYAERVAPFHQFGPPRKLREVTAVRAWVIENARLEPSHRTRLLRDQRDAHLAGVG